MFKDLTLIIEKEKQNHCSTCALNKSEQLAKKQCCKPESFANLETWKYPYFKDKLSGITKIIIFCVI